MLQQFFTKKQSPIILNSEVYYQDASKVTICDERPPTNDYKMASSTPS